MAEQDTAVADPHVEASNLAPVEATAPSAEQVEAVETPEGATAQERPSLSAFSDDDLMAHLRERKDANGLSIEDRLRKSERDKTRAELRRQQGDKDVLNRWETELLRKYGVDPDSMSDEDRAQARYLSQIASERQRIDVARTFTEGVLEQFDEQERSNIRARIDQLDTSGDFESLEALRDAVLTESTNRAVSNSRKSLKPKDVDASFWDDDSFSPESIPVGSKAHKAMREWLESEFQKEQEARMTEQSQGRVNPPATSLGAPVGDQLAQLASMPKEQRIEALIANPELRDKAWDAVAAARG